MKVYKLRHKPTGLYFKPSLYRDQANLGQEGKLYYRKPALASYQYYGVRFPGEVEKSSFIHDDWEVVTYTLEEKSCQSVK